MRGQTPLPVQARASPRAPRDALPLRTVREPCEALTMCSTSLRAPRDALRPAREPREAPTICPAGRIYFTDLARVAGVTPEDGDTRSLGACARHGDTHLAQRYKAAWASVASLGACARHGGASSPDDPRARHPPASRALPPLRDSALFPRERKLSLVREETSGSVADTLDELDRRMQLLREGLEGESFSFQSSCTSFSTSDCESDEAGGQVRTTYDADDEDTDVLAAAVGGQGAHLSSPFESPRPLCAKAQATEPDTEPELESSSFFFYLSAP